MRVLNGKYIEVTEEYAKEALKLSNSTAVLSELQLNVHDFTKTKAHVKDIYDEISHTIFSIEKIEFLGPKAQILVINTDNGEHKDHVVMADVLK